MNVTCLEICRVVYTSQPAKIAYVKFWKKKKKKKTYIEQSTPLHAESDAIGLLKIKSQMQNHIHPTEGK